jgi:hypothetical protein
MMKLFLITAGVTAAATAYAGGVVGGNPGLAYIDSNFVGGSTGGYPNLSIGQGRDLKADVRFIDSLPKEYVSPSVYKRTLMRLSPAGVETTPMLLRGQYIDVTKVEDRVVDTSVTSEILSE